MSILAAALIASAILTLLVACLAIMRAVSALFDGDLVLAAAAAGVWLIFAALTIYIGSNAMTWGGAS